MKGSVEQAGTGRWRIAVEVGQDPTGKRKRYVKTVKGNRRGAEREIVLLATRQHRV